MPGNRNRPYVRIDVSFVSIISFVNSVRFIISVLRVNLMSLCKAGFLFETTSEIFLLRFRFGAKKYDIIEYI